jgi:uncharacterized protein (UPF0335 family)
MTEVNEAITKQTQDRLKSFIDRIETVEAELQDHRDAKSEIYAELKGEGFDAKAVRKIISLRKKDKMKREQEEAMVDLYVVAIGGL